MSGIQEPNEEIYAVLTGDVVSSSQYSPEDLKRVMQILRQGAGDFSNTFPNTILGELDIFSGDGWQVLIQDWRKCVRLAVYLRVLLKAEDNLKADTRVSIGIGAVDTANLNLKKISESTGPAFARSGRTLQSLKKPFMMTWAGSAGDSESRSLEDRWAEGTMRLLDVLVSRWKPKQARSVSLALLGKEQHEIAKTLKVKQPTVSDSLSSVGWRGIEYFLDEIEK